MSSRMMSMATAGRLDAGRRVAGKLAPAKIDFFYDVASPYSWFAFETLMRYRNIWEAEISLRPYFLGGVMQASGNKPPGTLKAKKAYMAKDLARMAEHHGVPIVPLEDFLAMFDTLGAQRLLTAAAMEHPESLESLSRELWRRIWGGGGEIVSAKGLGEACSRAGLTRDATGSLLSRAGEAGVKARLKEVTEEALERGAFGAPWITIRVDDRPWEAFFGCDRFEVLAKALGQPWFGPHPPPSKL
ncbi:unnamed protein product [Ascophyllum nodosum]